MVSGCVSVWGKGSWFVVLGSWFVGRVVSSEWVCGEKAGAHFVGKGPADLGPSAALSPSFLNSHAE
jgi:hypothetical protein